MLLPCVNAWMDVYVCVDSPEAPSFEAILHEDYFTKYDLMPAREQHKYQHRLAPPRRQ